MARDLEPSWDEVSRFVLGRRHAAPGIPRDLSPVQLQSLIVLSAGDLKMGELAASVGLAESSVTRMVDRLEEAGLAARRRVRPDRRSVLVGLTLKGRRLVDRARAARRDFLGELLATLEPDERAQLVALYGKLAAALRASRERAA